jgi:hypothetical protein
MTKEGPNAASKTKGRFFFKYAKVAKIDLHTPTDRFHIGSTFPTETCSFVRLMKELRVEKERFGKTDLAACSSLIRKDDGAVATHPPPADAVRSSTGRPIERFYRVRIGWADWLTGYLVKQQAANKFQGA